MDEWTDEWKSCEAAIVVPVRVLTALSFEWGYLLLLLQTVLECKQTVVWNGDMVEEMGKENKAVYTAGAGTWILLKMYFSKTDN